MPVVAFDTETRRFSPGRQIEDLACLSVCAEGDDRPRLYGRNDAAAALAVYLQRPDFILTGWDTSFDVLVMIEHDRRLWPLFLAAYRADRIRCAMLRAMLLDIAHIGFLKTEKGAYSLATHAKAQGFDLEKGETGWQLRFGELLHLPLWQWPEPAKAYATTDALATLRVDQAQEKYADRFLRDQYRQARGALPIRAMSAYGVVCDPRFVEAHERATLQAHTRTSGIMRDAGILRPDHVLKSGPRKGQVEPGTLDTKVLHARVTHAYGLLGEKPPETDKGNVCADKLSLRKSGDWILRATAERQSLAKILNEELPIMRRGCVEPIHPYHRYLVVSGRKGCKAPNLDNRPNRFGAREAFMPRPGYAYAFSDFSGLETATLAECQMALFGRSEMAEKLKQKIDLHTEFASRVLGISYADAKRRKDNPEDKEMWRARQVGKVFNFGKPGGLGVGSLIDFADRQYQVKLSIEDSRMFTDLWFRTFPEMRRYFAAVDAQLKRSGGVMIQIYTDRIRGRCGYTDGCNTLFQGMGADIFKEALFEVFVCMLDPTSPLYGSHIVLAPHDEIGTEAPISRAYEAGLELDRVMDGVAARFLKHVPLTTGGVVLMDHWCKDAPAAKKTGGKIFSLAEHMRDLALRKLTA